MSKQELMAIWTQVITGVTVVIGLAMVVYELKQTQDLAHIQLEHEGVVTINESLLVRQLSESFSVTRARELCLEPSKLTVSEIFDTRLPQYSV